MKHLTILILSMIVIVSLCACSKKAALQKEAISLIEEDSFFSDFEVKDGLVFIKCYLAIQNNSASDLAFTVSADFAKDVRIGLLKDPVLYVCDSQNQVQVLYLKAGETEEFECIFVGAHGGSTQKTDRNLPDNISFHQQDGEQDIDWSVSNYSEATESDYEETASGYKAAFYYKREIDIKAIENWLSSCEPAEGYYQYIYSDPDSWDMFIYYSPENGSISVDGFRFAVIDSVVKIDVQSDGSAGTAGTAADYLLIRVQAPQSGAWPNTSELYIDGKRIDRQGADFLV